ncbi:MAG TPA: primosomal protein N' [Candidatus Omnitrophota bacterium]|nr:primosomal protein N' [Candidatus Omnitrophota bacterium]
MSLFPAQYVAVALPLPLEHFYTYFVPDELIEKLIVGGRVRVPFKNREIVGYVVQKDVPCSEYKTKPIMELLDDQPVLDSKMLALTRWIADYYGCSWGEAIENALPRWVKFGKPPKEKKEDAFTESAPSGVSSRQLTSEQTEAFTRIQQELNKPAPSATLLVGVTGSGKSELYIRAIHEALKKGKSAICLVPEIALTEQLRFFFANEFGSLLEMLHSKMTDRERFIAWRRIREGKRRVVLGPRSAVFAPVIDLGLIVIDEEHETSYKQETTPRYHAREAAEKRAQLESALLLMGTATPSLESMERVLSKKWQGLRLTQRVDGKKLPDVRLVDLKQYPKDPRQGLIFSPPLTKEIEKNLKAGEGTMLLLNRRGFSTFIQAAEGDQEILKCKRCDIPMTFHQMDDLLLCHYCNDRIAFSKLEKQKPNQFYKMSGFGTEKVESEAGRLFPGARIARLDADVMQKRGSHQEILDQFREQKIDILIGTQMIAKGFDFSHVTLVGVILADIGLKLPDFRSSERTFQLLTQVAGRAGRGDKPGRVYVQTVNPDHPAILFAQRQDYDAFYQYALPLRRELNYPPFSRLLNIIIRSPDENKAYAHARAVRDAVKQCLPALAEGQLMGPAPLPFYKLRGHVRWHVMLKVHDAEKLAPLFLTLNKLKKPSGVQVAWDMDPVNIL